MYRFPWSSQPLNPPALAAQRGAHGAITVYASWNGATGVSAWRVLAGSSAASVAPVAQAPHTGFETGISIPKSDSYIAVQALDANGQVLGGTPPTALSRALR